LGASVEAVYDAGRLLMADVSTLEEGLAAALLGADVIVTIRIIWPVLFTLSGGMTDHPFEAVTSADSPDLQRCDSTRWIPPNNSNRTRHLFRTERDDYFDK